MTDVQITMNEAEAASVLQRASGHAKDLAAALGEATSAVERTDRDDVARALGKLIELQRLVAVRLDLLTKRVAAGRDLQGDT